jgi:septum formation topological specificity factor MinE
MPPHRTFVGEPQTEEQLIEFNEVAADDIIPQMFGKPLRVEHGPQVGNICKGYKQEGKLCCKAMIDDESSPMAAAAVQQMKEGKLLGMSMLHYDGTNEFGDASLCFEPRRPGSYRFDDLKMIACSEQERKSGEYTQKPRTYYYIPLSDTTIELDMQQQAAAAATPVAATPGTPVGVPLSEQQQPLIDTPETKPQEEQKSETPDGDLSELTPLQQSLLKKHSILTKEQRMEALETLQEKERLELVVLEERKLSEAKDAELEEMRKKMADVEKKLEDTERKGRVQEGMYKEYLQGAVEMMMETLGNEVENQNKSEAEIHQMATERINRTDDISRENTRKLVEIACSAAQLKKQTPQVAAPVAPVAMDTSMDLDPKTYKDYRKTLDAMKRRIEGHSAAPAMQRSQAVACSATTPLTPHEQRMNDLYGQTRSIMQNNYIDYGRHRMSKPIACSAQYPDEISAIKACAKAHSDRLKLEGGQSLNWNTDAIYPPMTARQYVVQAGLVDPDDILNVDNKRSAAQMMGVSNSRYNELKAIACSASNATGENNYWNNPTKQLCESFYIQKQMKFKQDVRFGEAPAKKFSRAHASAVVAGMGFGST